MDSLFRDLGTADASFLAELTNITNWLSQQAREILDLIDAGRTFEANQRIRTARKDIRPYEAALTDAINNLFSLEAEFVELAGVL
jgi:hypothetical protein